MAVFLPNSPTPWQAETDHLNPRYLRIRDASGDPLARVYRPQRDAWLFLSAPDMREFLNRICNGWLIGPTEARQLLATLRERIK